MKLENAIMFNNVKPILNFFVAQKNQFCATPAIQCVIGSVTTSVTSKAFNLKIINFTCFTGQ